jgi:hypothetical protein
LLNLGIVVPEIFTALDTKIDTEGNANNLVNNLGEKVLKGDGADFVLKPFAVDEHGVWDGITVDVTQLNVTVFVADYGSARH